MHNLKEYEQTYSVERMGYERLELSSMKLVGKEDTLNGDEVCGISVIQKMNELFPAFQGPRSRTLKMASYLTMLV